MMLLHIQKEAVHRVLRSTHRNNLPKASSFEDKLVLLLFKVASISKENE